MKSKTITILIFLSIIGINLYFGLPRLGSFAAVDESLWSYERVPKFWKSVTKGNWKGTSICDKPGITLAMVSGIGLPFSPNPEKYDGLKFQQKTQEQLGAIKSIYYHLRLPVFLFTLLMLPVFYFLLKRLLGINAARFSVIFIGLSPILLGISLIINSDAMLWVFMPLALISFLIYQKESSQKFLLLSGFLLGLALITKYVVNFLLPFFLILIFLKYIFSDYSKDDGIKYFKKSMADYGLLILIALATIFIFYPSAWVKPKELLNTTIYSLAFKKIWPIFVGGALLIAADIFFLKSPISGKISGFISARKTAFVQIISAVALFLIIFIFFNTYAGMKFYNFEEILSAPKPDASFFAEFPPNFLSSFFPLIFGLIPLVTLLFILTIALMLKNNAIEKNGNLKYGFCFLVFILAYYLANSFSGISAMVRYQIVCYPIASIVAAIGLENLIGFEKIKKYFLGFKFYLLIIFLFIFSAISLSSIQPFYLSYASDLLPKKYILNPLDMGDGSWEISQYLNNLPGSENLSVWTDKKQVCENFIGKCSYGIKSGGAEIKFDYFVTSAGGKSKTINYASLENSQIKIGAGLFDPGKFYSPDQYFNFRVIIGNRPNNYIKVIKASDLNKL